MKIIVLGTRGIPDILGGVETHCEELYPLISKQGHDVTVVTRRSYVADKKETSYKGVKLKHIYAPKYKSIEAVVHTFLGVIYAGIKRPDILHIHAVGPMIMTPFARLLGLKVVVTNHGPDYDRQKWGKMARLILKTGEYMGVKFASEVVVISEVINSILKKKYNRQDAHLIYNGVNIPVINTNLNYISSLGLERNNYIIAVGRFVEEKGFHDLLVAYLKLKTDTKLVLVGDSDHETRYSNKIKQDAKKAGVVLTGFIKGDNLSQIFSHARLFVMPSYHEGLPIALLEAMSYNLNVLVSDIPANLEVGLEKSMYFEVGNVNDLKDKINTILLKNNSEGTDFSKKVNEDYNWNKISLKLVEVYNKVKN